MRPITEARRRHKCKTKLQDEITKFIIKIETPPKGSVKMQGAEKLMCLVNNLTMICEDYVEKEVEVRYLEELDNGWLDARLPNLDKAVMPDGYQDWRFDKKGNPII